MKSCILILLLLIGYCLSQDIPERQYSIVQMKFTEEYDVIKVKVPNWLKTSELVEQLKLVITWPGEPLPRKKTFIYVFKETDQIGATSKIGCIYIPDQGFIWSLTAWEPDTSLNQPPSDREIEIYSAFVDSVLKKGITFNNETIRHQIARQFGISIYKLDSIYTRVKHWWMLQSDTQQEANR